MEVYVWGLMRNDFITPDKVIKDWNVISWSAKWLGDSKIMSAVQTKKEAIARDDKRITKKLWSLFDEAEILIAHNGRRFDIKKINTRFYMNDMGVPSSYLVIDTLIEARKNFAFSSNKLDYLGELMISKKKLSTDFQLWKDCLAGNVEQLKRMQAYNDMDVRLLEEVYLEMRPWMKSHPNIALMLNGKGDSCPTCASTDIKENGAYYTTQANQYVSYRCNNCGAISRSMQGEIPLSNRKRLIRTVAR
jgi:RNase P subunit RPR2